MKKESPLYNYGECHVCGEQMVEENIKQDLWVKDQLIVIEDIPAGVCPQCGEKVVKAHIGQQIAALIADSKRLREARTIRVPVIPFAQDLV